MSPALSGWGFMYLSVSNPKPSTQCGGHRGAGWVPVTLGRVVKVLGEEWGRWWWGRGGKGRRGPVLPKDGLLNILSPALAKWSLPSMYFCPKVCVLCWG